MANRKLIYRSCPDNGSTTGREVHWDYDIREQVAFNPPINTCDPFHLEPGTLIDSWCEGSTRIEITAIWDGIGRPPLTGYKKVEVPNSSACNIQNACGLSVVDVVTTQQADGTFTANVVTNISGDIEFSLNGFMSVSPTRIFTGLSAGSYIASARIRQTAGTVEQTNYADTMLIYREVINRGIEGSEEYRGIYYHFHVSTLTVTRTEDREWGSNFIAPLSYPTNTAFYTTCDTTTFTKTLWFHDGAGGAIRKEEYNATSCGYTQPACVASKAFTIDQPRQARYCMHWKDYQLNSHTLLWWEQGYTGTCEKLCWSENILDLEWPGTGNKQDVLHGSSATIHIVVERYDFLINFLTTDERKYKVEHLVNEQLNWSGWHIPDQYHESWTATPFLATLNAYDGIGGLENMLYLDENNERYYGRARGIDIIARILRKLDLEIPLYLAINVWEDTMDLNVEPLSQAYYDQGAYYDEEGTPLNCKEVLERILRPFNAILKQARGALHIIRFTEVSGVYRRRKCILGKGDTQLQFDLEPQDYLEEYEILLNDEVSYREGNQEVTSIPALKQVTSITEYGEYENFVLNGDFEQWVADRPIFWEGTSAVERILDEGKYHLGYMRPNENAFLRNNAYPTNVYSSVGFTFTFDYTIAIEDFLEVPGAEWLVYPEFTLGNGAFTMPTGHEAPKASFNGNIVTYAGGKIADVSGVGAGRKRIDLVYATPQGAIVYVKGTENNMTGQDLVLSEPTGSLVVTYVTWEADTPRFASTSTALSASFKYRIAIGENYVYLPANGRRINTTTNTIDPEHRRSIGSWVSNNSNLSQDPIIYYHQDLSSKDGYTFIEGTMTLHIKPMSVPGLPSVTIFTPGVNRDNLRGVSITIDNVRLQERKINGIERMLITGENPGKINTKPLDWELHHGSGIPRTEALITLEDGTPTKMWNGAEYLQELVVRDLLAQHVNASLVLSASLNGPVSPISIVIDPFSVGNRFFIDKFVYSGRTGITAISAIQVFGGLGNGETEENVRLLEDGTPRVTEADTYRLLEA